MLIKVEKSLIQNTEFPTDAKQKVMRKVKLYYNYLIYDFLITVAVIAIHSEMNCYWNPQAPTQNSHLNSAISRKSLTCSRKKRIKPKYIFTM